MNEDTIDINSLISTLALDILDIQDINIDTSDEDDYIGEVKFSIPDIISIRKSDINIILDNKDEVYERELDIDISEPFTNQNNEIDFSKEYIDRITGVFVPNVYLGEGMTLYDEKITESRYSDTWFKVDIRCKAYDHEFDNGYKGIIEPIMVKYFTDERNIGISSSVISWTNTENGINIMRTPNRSDAKTIDKVRIHIQSISNLIDRDYLIKLAKEALTRYVFGEFITDDDSLEEFTNSIIWKCKVRPNSVLDTNHIQNVLDKYRKGDSEEVNDEYQIV